MDVLGKPSTKHRVVLVAKQTEIVDVVIEVVASCFEPCNVVGDGCNFVALSCLFL